MEPCGRAGPLSVVTTTQQPRTHAETPETATRPLRHRVLDRAVLRAPAVLAGALFADAAMHLYWTTGATWPAPDTMELSTAVLGFVVPFTPGVLLPLASMLLVAGIAVLGIDRTSGAVQGICQLVSFGVTTAVAIRGLLGAVWALGIGGYQPAAFRLLNLFCYLPLCLILTALGLLVLSRNRRGRRRIAAGTAVLVAIAVVAGLLGAAAWSPIVRNGSGLRVLAGDSYVETRLARFHYARQGTGSPVVLLAPGSAPLMAWEAELSALTAHHTVYLVELPGQGRTTLRTGQFSYDLAGMAGAVGEFLDAVGVDRAVLGGNSWSGAFALDFARQHPDRVTGLMLLAPSGLARPDPLSWEAMKVPVLGQAMANLAAASRSTTESGVRALFVHQDAVSDDLIDQFWIPSTFPGNRHATVELEQRLDFRELQRALPTVRTPTLVLWGAADSVLPAGNAAEFDRLLPDADVQVLPGCGHALSIDCPAPVVAAMQDFLDDL